MQIGLPIQICIWFDSDKPKYTTRLVAEGFKQEYNVDYDEILSPVVKMTTLQPLLEFVATEDLELEQFDVKPNFLHGDLEEKLHGDGGGRSSRMLIEEKPLRLKTKAEDVILEV